MFCLFIINLFADGSISVVDVSHAIIRANVMAGIRPSLSNDDECLEEIQRSHYLLLECTIRCQATLQR